MTINTKDLAPGTFKVEGQSKLTPFEAMYVARGAQLVINHSHEEKSLSGILGMLIEMEKKHPDWHFEDWVKWTRNLDES